MAEDTQDSSIPQIDLFSKAAKRELQEELKKSKRIRLDPRMEKSMRTDNEKVTTARGRLLDLVAIEAKDNEPAGLIKTLEILSEPVTEVVMFKALSIKAALHSFSLGESTLKKLAESKGLTDKKLINTASWALTAQMVGVRTTEFLGTHWKNNTNPAIAPIDNVFSKITSSVEGLVGLQRKRIVNGNPKDVWYKYCELSSQDRLNYSVRIGNSEDESSQFALEDGAKDETVQERCKSLASLMDASVKSYFDFKKDAADSGQPIGYLDEENQRVPLPDDQTEIPIALCMVRAGRTIVKVVNFDRNSDIESNGMQIYRAMDDRNAWKELGESDRALFAVNINLQPRLLSDEAGEECLRAMSNLRPMGVFMEGVHTNGNRVVEYIANHTVTDGIAADAFINGVTLNIPKKDSYGITETIEHKKIGIKGFFNEGKSESQKLKSVEYYPDEGIVYEKYKTSKDICDVVVSRTKKEGEHGADVLQSSVLAANEIFIEYMRELHGGIWNEMENGANNTHVDKDKPLERLIPASIYRRNADNFKNVPGFNNYSEVLGLLSSLVSYKENRWLIDNYSNNIGKPEWQEHSLPASCLAMAVVTESDLPRWMKRQLLRLQEHKWFDRVRYAITYNQTIVTDKARPGESDKAATHKTVNNDGLPGVSIREEGAKLEMTFSESETGRLMPPDSLEAYAELVTNVTKDISQILSEFQKSWDSGKKLSLSEINAKLVEMKARNRMQLRTHSEQLSKKRDDDESKAEEVNEL
jgi:hypothetical protein